VPRSGDAVIARENFYELRRPSTTQFEKVVKGVPRNLPSDIRKKMFLKNQIDRENLLRQVWLSTNSTFKEKAITLALSGMNLEPHEIKSERTKASANLNTPLEQLDIALEKLNTSQGMVQDVKIFTAATWTVQTICKKFEDGDSSMVAPEKGSEFLKGCENLKTYFIDRDQRISNSVTVEIVQPPDIKLFKVPAYSDEQYTNIKLQYLRAALIADKYP
jgi:hypothetical protein